MSKTFLNSMPINNVYTTNNALSYSNPDEENQYTNRLKLFFKSIRNIDTETFLDILKESSKENIDETILLVFNLRDIKDGKGERKIGRIGLKWLFEKIQVNTYF